MTSEIRANTIKNRVGLGTVSFTNTGPVVSGIVTANTIRLADDNKIQLGNDQDLEIVHDPSNGIIRSISSGGNMHVESKNHIELNVNYNPSNGSKHNAIKANANSSVTLYHANAAKIATTSTGAQVYGTLVATGADINGDLDVDGHTNLDNVSIAGVTTTTGFIESVGTSGRGAKLGGLSVGYDTLYATVQPFNGNFLHLNYNAGTYVKIGASSTKVDLEVNGDITPKASGNRDLGLSTKKWKDVHATTYYGDGSNLTGTQTTINNNANNRIITGSGTANTLDAEAALTFYNSGSDPILTLENSGNPQLRLRTTSTTDNCTIDFGDGDAISRGRIVYTNNGDNMLFYTNGTSGGEKLKLYSNGRLNLSPQRSIHADTMLHVEAPSSISSGETNVKFEGNATMGARLSLQNNDTSGSANNQLAFCDAGGQSTSTIIGYNTDQTNNYGELVFATRNAQGTPPEQRVRIKSDGTSHFYGNQTNTPEGDFGFRWDKNQPVNLQITNTNNTSVNAGARITMKANIGALTGSYYNNGGFYLINSANGYFNYYSNNTLRVNINTNGDVFLNPDDANGIPTSNGYVGKRFGVKSTANNVIIGETTQSGAGYGLHLESRQTGRSGDARFAQIGLRNDASGNGQISFFTAPSGAGVSERMNISSAGYVTKPETPSWMLRPSYGSNQTLGGGSHAIGWSSGSGSNASAKGLRLKNVTLSGSGFGSNLHNGQSVGKITVPVAGVYYIWCTIRMENNPTAGNLFLYIDGTSYNVRQHVEMWAHRPYMHGRIEHIVNLNANSFIIWGVNCNGGVVSGTNDTVNWCGGHLIG